MDIENLEKSDPNKECEFDEILHDKKILEDSEKTFKPGPVGRVLGNNKKKYKTALAFWFDIVLNLIIIIGLVLVIRTYLISPFQVYGSSMCDTFNNFNGTCSNGYGEYLIVNKLGYQNFFGYQVGLPKRGDIVVFHPPHNPSEFFIKRIIGLPGETVRLIDDKVVIFNEEHSDGWEINEPYLNEKNSGNTKPRPDLGSIFEIPNDSYFVLGDNRTGSSDSRSCFADAKLVGNCFENNNSAYLTMEHIQGKAAVVLWPLNKISTIKRPDY